MKFSVSSTGLFSRLQAISRVINSKNSLPILDCFLMQLTDQTLSLTASDGETTLTTRVEVNDSNENGEFAISSKTLLDALKEIPEQPLVFDVNLSSLEITIYYQNGKYSLVGQSSEEYPQMPQPGNNTVNLTIDTPSLLAGISNCLFAASDDELRRVMCGIYIDIAPEHLTFVASDGHKLVRNRFLGIQGNEHAAFILPRKPANLLKNLLPKEQGDAQIAFDDRNASFTLENYHLVCRLIEGRFPNYNAVIPSNNPFRITIERTALLSALRRVLTCSSKSSNLVEFKLEEGRVQISGQDNDFSTSAEETILCEYNGKAMSIGFKAPFFIDILNSMNTQEVAIELADPSRAGLVLPVNEDENNELLMLIMPMMLNS